MDTVTAALAGTVVGSIATLLAGIIGPGVAARTASRREQRRDTRDEIASVVQALMALLNARHTSAPDQRTVHANAVIANTRLSVLLGPDELELENAMDYALGIVSTEPYPAAVAATEALRNVLHSWYRGEVKGKKLGDRYAIELEGALERVRTNPD